MAKDGHDKKRDVLPEDAVYNPSIAAVVDKFIATPPRKQPKDRDVRRVTTGRAKRPSVKGGRNVSHGSIPANSAKGSTDTVTAPRTAYEHRTCRLCPALAGKNGLCVEHYAQAKARRSGQVAATRQITDEDRVEVKRRHARFESGPTIAKALGLTSSQVRSIIKPR